MSPRYAGQRDAAAGLGVAGAGLGELARHAAHLDDGHRGAVGEHDGHLQDGLHAVADLVGGRAGEGLGAVAALQQERLAARAAASRSRRMSTSPAKTSGGSGRELSGCRVRGLGVGPLRLLLDRQGAPIVEAGDHGGICVDDRLDELYHGTVLRGSGAVRREWERGAARRAAAAFEPTAIGRRAAPRTELA